MVAEHWRPVPGFGGYEVSDLGRVRSWLVPGCVWASRKEPRVLKLGSGRGGYSRVGLCRRGKRHPRSVHQLVMEAFVGPCPDGQEVAHRNGVRTDNRLANLRYATRPNNNADRILHGTTPRGERNPRNHLAEDQVREIRARLVQGARRAQLAEDYGVSYSAIKHIANRTSWGWLE